MKACAKVAAQWLISSQLIIESSIIWVNNYLTPHAKSRGHRYRQPLGRYEIRSTIGKCGMGEVYLAWDSQPEGQAAL